MNGGHKNLSFTNEVEQESTLSFLDIKLWIRGIVVNALV